MENTGPVTLLTNTDLQYFGGQGCKRVWLFAKISCAHLHQISARRRCALELLQSGVRREAGSAEVSATRGNVCGALAAAVLEQLAVQVRAV